MQRKTAGMVAIIILVVMPMHYALAATTSSQPTALSVLQWLAGVIEAGTTRIIASIEDTAGDLATALDDRLAAITPGNGTVAYTAAAASPAASDQSAKIQSSAPPPSPSADSPVFPAS